MTLFTSEICTEVEQNTLYDLFPCYVHIKSEIILRNLMGRFQIQYAKNIFK